MTKDPLEEIYEVVKEIRRILTSPPYVVELDTDPSKCPGCGGPTTHDRCYPPNPYYCDDCERWLDPEA
jgi:hypothetical protein